MAELNVKRLLPSQRLESKVSTLMFGMDCGCSVYDAAPYIVLLKSKCIKLPRDVSQYCKVGLQSGSKSNLNKTLIITPSSNLSST